jgi:CDGSH-type Zn-finger protein
VTARFKSGKEGGIVEKTEIVVFNDGPLKVRGDIVLKDAAGQTFDLTGRGTVALCRCGQSAKKPFCDGSHNACGFASTVTAG